MDEILKENLLNKIVAVNFNLYENQNNTWSIKFVGEGFFDENNDDWACDKIYININNPFEIKSDGNLEDVLKIFTDYL